MTLVELMVGALVATIIIAAGYAVLTSSSKAMTTNEQTVETQQNVRVAMEFLFRDIRQAGFGMNGPVGNCPTAVVPADNNTAGPDRGSGSDQPGVAGRKSCGNRHRPALILNSDTTIGSGHAACASLGRRGHQYDERSGRKSHGAACDHLDRRGDHHDGDGCSRRQPDCANGWPPTAMKRNSPIYLLQCITYQIIPPPDPTGLCAGRSPCLVRGVAGGMTAGVLDCTTVGSRCTSIADEIEDIQFAYGCDGCVAAVNGGDADGIIDNQGGAADSTRRTL